MLNIKHNGLKTLFACEVGCFKYDKIISQVNADMHITNTSLTFFSDLL